MEMSGLHFPAAPDGIFSNGLDVLCPLQSQIYTDNTHTRHMHKRDSSGWNWISQLRDVQVIHSIHSFLGSCFPPHVTQYTCSVTCC